MVTLPALGRLRNSADRELYDCCIRGVKGIKTCSRLARNLVFDSSAKCLCGILLVWSNKICSTDNRIMLNAKSLIIKGFEHGKENHTNINNRTKTQ